ncbi:hypothetical protein [Deinococcus koreensis]|uniref:Uncharacterized protein n=1 Tax=Deinococcus koreensis TaxID=2054903 RepID=A0A2K3UWJ2_9DEIO|nr:hypothetical protein [Deinococcus koreensis]PNY80890.1 hypothetical protein CVO96_05470 [Deinococcus koreensis]
MSLLDDHQLERYRTLWNGDLRRLANQAIADGLSTMTTIYLLRVVGAADITTAKTVAIEASPDVLAFYERIAAEADELERHDADEFSGPAPS